MGDGDQPRLDIGADWQVWVGLHRGQERLRPGVAGADGPQYGPADAQHGRSVGGDGRRKRLLPVMPCKRPGTGFCEIDGGQFSSLELSGLRAALPGRVLAIGKAVRIAKVSVRTETAMPRFGDAKWADQVCRVRK